MLMNKLKWLHLLSLFLTLAAVPALAEDLPRLNVDYMNTLEYENDRDLLDIYMPEAASDVPVIIFFHGGGLQSGNKEHVREVAARLTPMGIGVVTPNYRLSPDVMHPAHVEDAAAVVAWVVSNIKAYGGNPRQIYLGGHSAGAYLAVLLSLDKKYLLAHGLEPGLVRGTVAVSPFLYVEETAKVRPKTVWGTNPVDWLAASVTPHIESGKQDVLLIYADGDEDWRKKQNNTFASAMQAVGNDVKVVEVPDRDHMTLIEKVSAEDDRIRDLIVNFIGVTSP